ncbi:hypothetical protein RUND412_010065 [Rhizina undulata]
MSSGSHFYGGIHIGFEKLNRSNYCNWKFLIETYLFQKDLWEVVSGEEPEPKISSPKPTSTEEEALKKWKKKSQDKNGKYAWEALESTHEANTGIARSILRS